MKQGWLVPATVFIFVLCTLYIYCRANLALRLTLGLFFVTMFISMWISNTAATAMMIPIMETVLVELQAVRHSLFCFVCLFAFLTEIVEMRR